MRVLWVCNTAWRVWLARTHWQINSFKNTENKSGKLLDNHNRQQEQHKTTTAKWNKEWCLVRCLPLFSSVGMSPSLWSRGDNSQTLTSAEHTHPDTQAHTHTHHSWNWLQWWKHFGLWNLKLLKVQLQAFVVRATSAFKQELKSPNSLETGNAYKQPVCHFLTRPTNSLR